MLKMMNQISNLRKFMFHSPRKSKTRKMKMLAWHTDSKGRENSKIKQKNAKLKLPGWKKRNNLCKKKSRNCEERSTKKCKFRVH
jgi:hypothetical protein